MKTLSRLLLILLAAALLGSAYELYTNTSQISLGHEMFYRLKRPWVHDAREISLYGVLIWCLLFVRSDPFWVRIGLLAVILSFVVLALPPKILKEPLTLPSWH